MALAGFGREPGGSYGMQCFGNRNGGLALRILGRFVGACVRFEKFCNATLLTLLCVHSLVMRNERSNPLFNFVQNEAKLSILIALFNKEYYLDQCLRSVFKTGLDDSEFFVVIGDDGSTDDGIRIINNYSMIHSNIIYFRNKVNLGTHMTRLNLVRRAQTSHIVFIDPDDAFIKTGLQTAFRFARTHNYDMVQYGCRQTLKMRKGIRLRCWGEMNVGVLTMAKYRKGIRKNKMNSYVWRKVFRTSTYKEAIDSMPESIQTMRLLHSEDRLQMIYFEYASKTSMYTISDLGYERHSQLNDNSGSYQNSSSMWADKRMVSQLVLEMAASME